MYITSFLFVLLCSETVKADCPSDKSHLAQVRLKNDLLCGYEKTIRPVVNYKDPVNVTIRMILKYFVYEVHDSTFSIDSWLAMFWKDEHLKWDPSKYDSIKQIQLTSDEIWVPDLSVYNKRDQSGSPAAVDTASCIVIYPGQVICVPPGHQSSLCVGDLTRYPFDTQNCTVRFGSWVHNGEELNIKLTTPPITTEDLVPNGEWGLIEKRAVKNPGKYKCCPNNTYPSINYSFKIRRLSGAHAASVILPALALVVITLISLWIPPNHSDRLNLCCINLLCEFLYLQYVSYLLPMHGENIPLILLFARDSLLLSAFTILLSVILRNMVDNAKPAPGWMAGTVSILISTKPGQYVFLNDSSAKGVAKVHGEDDGTTIIETNANSANQEWFIFAIILDRICFVVYFVLYLVMLLKFTP